MVPDLNLNPNGHLNSSHYAYVCRLASASDPQYDRSKTHCVIKISCATERVFCDFIYWGGWGGGGLNNKPRVGLISKLK